MAPPESVPRIQDSDEFAAEAAKLGQSGCPILLQVGSEACVKCPAFTEAVAALAEEYDFEWRYCDAHEEGDIPEKEGITQLPAMVLIFHDKFCRMRRIAQQADAAQLREAVDKLCARKRPASVNLFDADF
tara:strand:+ start:2101 stop:2490 length:390 start_codon:yes stop_codon:yes gene_type:complete